MDLFAYMTYNLTKLNNNCSPLFGSVWSNCGSRYSQLQLIYYFWLMKPLSEGVYSNEMLPSFILQKKIKENKGEIKK